MEFCRLCYLETPLELCRDIFVPYQDDPPILGIIAKLADLKINKNDLYSKIICPNCYVRLISFHDFRQIILQTDLKFRNKHRFDDRKSQTNLETLITDNVIEIDSDDDDDDDDIETEEYRPVAEDNELSDEISEIETSDDDFDDEEDSIIALSDDSQTSIDHETIEDSVEQISATNQINNDKLFVGRPAAQEMPSQTYQTRTQSVCYICGKVYKDRRFDIHLRTHTGEKPYKCNVCDRRFTTSSSLKSHSRLHTGEKPYKCNYCNETFSQSSGLYYHLKIHTDKGPYNCNMCSKTFTRRFCLTLHLRVHAGLRPHECKICKKLFTRKSHLDVHLTLHGDEKPYQCEFCKRSYTHTAYLTRHQMKCTKRLKFLNK